MTQFRYTATDEMGRNVSGTTTAESPTDVRAALVEKGFKEVHVDAVSPYAAVSPHAPTAVRAIRGRVSVYALAMFFRQFQVLYRSGVPLQSALESLSRQTTSRRLSVIINQVREDLLAGAGLYNSMAKHAPAFSHLELSMIRAGEEGGFLDATLGHIADYLDHEIELRRMMRGVLFWPTIVLCFAVIVPPVTSIVIRSVVGHDAAGVPGGFLNDNTFWYVFLFAVVCLVAAFRVAMRSPAFRLGWDHVRLHIPFIGKTIHMLMMAKFGRALGALYRGGVPIARAIHLAGEASGSELIQNRLDGAVRRIESGQSVAHSLAQTGVFSELVMQMLRTGEQTGEVDKMLENVANFSEEEAKVRSRQAGITIGTLIYVGVAIYVFFIVAAFYGAYFSGIFKAAGG